MTAALIAVAVLLLVGFPAAVLSNREVGPGSGLALGLLFGIGIVSNEFFILSAVGVPWFPLAFPLLLGSTILLSWFFMVQRGSLPSFRTPLFRPFSLLAVVVWLAIGAVLAGYALFATMARPWEADFIGIWGLKGKIFWLHGGIDWGFLANPWNQFCHPDYPLLLPLTFDFISAFAGEWNGRFAGILYPFLSLACALLLAHLFRDELKSPARTAIAVLALLGVVITPWIGIADGPLVVFGGLALLFMRRGLQSASSNGSMLTGVVLLGLAAQIKNEGLTLVVAAILAMLMVTRNLRSLLAMWPAVALAVPWQIVRALLDLQSDLWSGPTLAHIQAHLLHPTAFLDAIAHLPIGRPLFWGGLIVGFAVIARRIFTRERFVLSALAFQFCFYILAYLATPHSIVWQVRWSWDRVVGQLAMPLAAVIVLWMLREIGETRQEPLPEKAGQAGS
ncbi:MAG: hypothetical protein WBX15_09910 [Thermoanaerobaculia bacterium]